MTTGRINQITAFPRLPTRGHNEATESTAAWFQLHEAEEWLEGFLSERDTGVQHVLRVSSQTSNCLDALLNVLPVPNQRYGSVDNSRLARVES